jgi:merlin protein
LERKSREAETLTARMIEESQKRATEAERLKNELINARIAEKEAKEKLLTFLSRATLAASPPPPPVVMQQPTAVHQLLTPDGFLSLSTQSLNDSNQQLYEDHIETNSYELGENDANLEIEIEKERIEYLAKSKQVACQLKGLRNEIELLKISESEFDRINAEQLRLGENKYSTLKKAIKSSTKHKVAFYEEL